VEFSWIKAHVGHCGKGLADKLAKEAASNKNEDVCYNRIAKSAVTSELTFWHWDLEFKFWHTLYVKCE
jgi:ribonuclease HI